MKKKRNDPKILTPDEEKKLLDWTHQNRSFCDYLAILTVLRTGLRATELRELLVSDIGADGKIVRDLGVRPELAHDRQPRTIPLPHDLREQLLAFLEWKQQQGESIEPTLTFPQMRPMLGTVNNLGRWGMKMLKNLRQQRPLPRQLQHHLVKRQPGGFGQINQKQIRQHLHCQTGIGAISALKSHPIQMHD